MLGDGSRTLHCGEVLGDVFKTIHHEVLGDGSRAIHCGEVLGDGSRPIFSAIFLLGIRGATLIPPDGKGRGWDLWFAVLFLHPLEVAGLCI